MTWNVGDRLTIGDDPVPWTVTYISDRAIIPGLAKKLSEGSEHEHRTRDRDRDPRCARTDRS